MFEPSVYDAFASSPEPRQAAKQLHMPKTNNVTEVDVRKCRRSALEQNMLAIPIFSPLGEIQPRTKMELGDYNFVAKDVNWTTVKYTQMLPFTDSRWYWKGAC